MAGVASRQNKPVYLYSLRQAGLRVFPTAIQKYLHEKQQLQGTSSSFSLLHSCRILLSTYSSQKARSIHTSSTRCRQFSQSAVEPQQLLRGSPARRAAAHRQSRARLSSPAPLLQQRAARKRQAGASPPPPPARCSPGGTGRFSGCGGRPRRALPPRRRRGKAGPAASGAVGPGAAAGSRAGPVPGRASVRGETRCALG